MYTVQKLNKHIKKTTKTSSHVDLRLFVVPQGVPVSVQCPLSVDYPDYHSHVLFSCESI